MALTVKMETVTLIGKDRIWRVLCIKCMKLIVKIFFQQTFYFGEFSSIFVNAFSFDRPFFLGGGILD